MKRLPLRALVALASRCARRIQSQYVLENDHPTKQTSTAAVDAAIRVAEEFAMGGAVDAKKTATATRDAEEAFAAAQDPEYAAEGSAHAAKAALAAVGAANIAFAVAKSQGMGKEMWAAIEIAGEAMIATMPDEETATRALAFDLETLAELKLGEFPEWGQTIDPMEDGPLGPLTPPLKRRKLAPTPQPDDTPKSSSNRTLQALERIDALQSELEEEEEDNPANRRRPPAAQKPKSSPPDINGAGIAELQQRLQKELERVLAAKTALDEERIQLQTERESFESRLKKAPGARGADPANDAEQRKLANERRQLQAERTALQEEQAAFADELEQFELRQNDFRQAERKLKRDKAKFNAQRKEFAEKRAKFRKHVQRLKAKQEELRQLQKAAGGGDASLLLEKLRPVQAGLQELDQEQSTLKTDLENLQDALAHISDNGGTHAAGAATDAELQAEIERLKAELVQAASTADARLEEERQKLKDAQAELEKRAKTFQENESALREALDRVRDEQVRFEMQQSELEKLKEELESQQRKFQTEQNRFQDLIDITFRR